LQTVTTTSCIPLTAHTTPEICVAKNVTKLFRQALKVLWRKANQ